MLKFLPNNKNLLKDNFMACRCHGAANIDHDIIFIV